MPVYMISYDLNKPRQNYNELYERIKSYGIWWHYLDSTWFIQTLETTEQVYNKLKQCLDDNDLFIIIEVKNNKSGWLPERAWDYLEGMFNS